ncbi:hypothetical protein DUNSADRAFT_13480 [Dunaliella salina]|uniref:Uncharacterized protein n=1 Tax=Dunaliella salina TaxID=3046 RepID=A0ABQ7G9B2_DUNSA|nr:hypothetical protein DUNSADRAFT_13480 [Dunaliella salina]|eukprot:KAF5831177.1 hypothetical protein DUNSADRAFT_13480 [Dunaliella salina]
MQLHMQRAGAYGGLPLHNCPHVLRPLSGRRVVCRSGGGGVEDLLQRDFAKKQEKIDPELRDEPQLPTTEEASTSKPLKSKRRRRESLVAAVKASEDAGESVQEGPRKCKEAIDKGLELFQAKDFQGAIAMWNLALELPGNGAYRLPSSPREYSCPSDAEENAALFNMACAYVQLGQKASALTCLEAVLENDFKDFQTIRSDPDLAPLGQELTDLVARYDNPVAQAKKGILGKVDEIFKGKKQMESDLEKPKPWILW